MSETHCTVRVPEQHPETTHGRQCALWDVLLWLWHRRHRKNVQTKQSTNKQHCTAPLELSQLAVVHFCQS